MISAFTKLAVRSTLRNRRRAVITVIAVAFATMLSVVLRSMQIGTYQANIEQALLLSTGAGQIQDSAYLQTPSLRHAFTYSDTLLTNVKNVAGVNSVAPTLTVPGMVSASGIAKPVAILGIEPDLEHLVSIVPDKVQQGRWINDTDTEGLFCVVVGKEFAKRNGTSIGDTLVIIGSDRYGSMSNEFFTVVGVYGIGAKQLETQVMYTHIETAAYFAAVENMCTMLKYTTQHADDAQEVATSVDAIIPKDLVARSWQELMPEMHQQIEMDDISGIIMVGVLMLLVVLGVANTVYISVVERLREFGIMLAVGARNTLLVRIVIVEVAFTTIVGVCLGLIPGIGITYWIQENPILLSSELGDLYAEYGFLPQLHSIIDIETIVGICFVIVGACVASAALPLWRVLVLEPLKGIRHT